MPSHDASASALGYIYQVRWALLELLNKAATHPDLSLTLERFDDVAWQTAGGDPLELIQLKHHKQVSGSLTDMSADVWRTLKVWMDDPKFRDVNGPMLSIVTTANAPQGSAASHLRTDGRDVAKAAELLEIAARTSIERTKTPKAREQWLRLTEVERLGILERTMVLDQSLRIEDLDGALESAVWISAPQGHAKDFLGVLDSWWMGVAIDLLRKKRPAIRAGELKAKLDEIRDGFLPDNLITTVGRFDGKDLLSTYGQHRFVQQLNWIEASPVNLKHAVADFHRAVTQTTHWIDRNLLEMSEFDSFKEALSDEWELAFDDMISDLPEDASVEMRKKAGEKLYRMLRDSTAVQVRPRYTEAFYARGIRHELAEGCQRGWHPDFEKLVESLTVGTT